MKKINIVENLISITEDDIILYSDSVSNFELDSGLSLEMPEPPWKGKLYIQDVYIRLFDNFTESTKQDTWEQGDLIFSTIEILIAAKVSRTSEPQN